LILSAEVEVRDLELLGELRAGLFKSGGIDAFESAAGGIGNDVKFFDGLPGLLIC
jgi:hypothetical protein